MYTITQTHTYIHTCTQVKALQEETGARVRFIASNKNKERSQDSESESESSEDYEGEKEGKGFMIVRGTPAQCERAWKISQVCMCMYLCMHACVYVHNDCEGHNLHSVTCLENLSSFYVYVSTDMLVYMYKHTHIRIHT
jgi:hypothetical protein